MVLDIGGGLAGAVGKFADWRNAAGERKLKLRELRQQSLDNNRTDDWIIGAIMFVFLWLVIVLPVFTFLGGSPELSQLTHQGIDEAFDGKFGDTLKLVIGTTVTAGGTSAVVKRYMAGKLANGRAR